MFIPSLQLHTWRDRDLLLISVPHSFGPYHIKSKEIEGGTYVRFGSTNQLADAATIVEIQRLKEHKYFDKKPNFDCTIKDINFELARELFAKISKKMTDRTAKSLGLIV